MSLELKSIELKNLVASYNTAWFLGNLSSLMKHIGKGWAEDELGKLSSPLRQLYFLAGLMITSDDSKGQDNMFHKEKWSQIVTLLNEIETEYDKLFFPTSSEEITEDWKHVRKVAMPSFLTYFNQGILNYEEQIINWVRDLFTKLDTLIEDELGLKTEDFLQFYENIDLLNQCNFQGHSTQPNLLRKNWKDYIKAELSFADDTPFFMRETMEDKMPMYQYIADSGIIDRFYPEEIVNASLSLDKVKMILSLLSIQRGQSEFIYYTETKPGNPLYEKPIVDIGGGMYQVFEVKQVIHAIENLLEQVCCKTNQGTTKYIDKKGELLEDKIAQLFSDFFKSNFKKYRGYYVDGCEQDILFLWKNYAFIIEAKGYSLREPFRNPEKAFIRIKDDFNACIGYGYEQTRRVEKKFIDQVPLRITDKNGNLIEEIDTTQYTEDFSIVVNLKSFGQIQCDLSTMIKLADEDDIYPWAVRLDDLEVFILTMIAQGKSPMDFIAFLLMRENLHGKLICGDELEICGSYLKKKLSTGIAENSSAILTTPDMASIFDMQYNKGMGFKNEKYLDIKKSGKYIFL